MNNQSEHPGEVEDRIVRPAEAEKVAGACDMTLRRWEDAGSFPKRFKLNPDGGPFGAVGWLYSDIQNWLRRRSSTARSTEAIE